MKTRHNNKSIGRRWGLGVATLFLATTACSSTTLEPIACTTQFVFGITIQVTDRATGLPITDGIAGTLVDGDFSEDMESFSNSLVGAGERAGTYDASSLGRPTSSTIRS